MFSKNFAQFSSFLASPKLSIRSNQNFGNKLKDVFALFVMKFFISIVLVILIKSFIDSDNIGLQNAKKSMSKAEMILLAGLLVPLLEETIFRLSLIFKPIYLSISSSLLFYIIISKYYFNAGFLNYKSQFALRVIISVSVGIILFFLAKKFSEKLRKFWKVNFAWIFYSLALFFAFAHITNFDINTKHLLLMPILTLPQLVGGAFLGYVRVKYGFPYAIAFHSTNNLIGIFFIVIS